MSGGGVSLTGAGRFLGTAWFQYRRTWRASVFSAFLGPLLYLGAIGFGLGSLVDTGDAGLGTGLDGRPLGYVAWLAPGLIAATAVQVGAGEAIFGTMAATKWRRTWFTAVSTPLAPGDLALGHLAMCGLRAGLAAVSYALVTVLFGILPPLRAALVVPAALLGAIALAAVVLAGMVLARSEQPMNAVQRFVVIPMFLFAGVFFPLSQLPGWLQAIAMATPLWHAVELARLAALGSPTAWGTWTHVAVLVGFVVVGVAVALRTFPRRLAA